MGLQKPKKTQGAPGARNGQFAKENVIEKQHFGARLQKQDFEASAKLPGWSDKKILQFCISDKGHLKKKAQFCNSD